MIPLSSGDSGPGRGESWVPFMLGKMVSVWRASAMSELPSGMIFLSTSGWIISSL